MKTNWTRQERNDLALQAKLGSKRAQAELLLSMEGLVVNVVNRYVRLSDNVTREDLKSVARLSILECIDKYDPDHPDAYFGGMAGLYMKRDVEMYVRQNSGPAYAPKSRFEREARIHLRRFLEEREKQGMSQSQALSEASKHFRMREDDLSFILSGSNHSKIGENVEDGEVQLQAAEDQAEDLQVSRVARLLDEIAAGLETDADREFVRLRFVEGLTMDQAAERLGMSRYQLKRRLHDLIMPHFRDEFAKRGLSLSDLL